MSTHHMVDESSETIDFGNESMMDQSLSNSVLDVSQSAAIRSSRRRLKKGSAVVLNTDRLQKYIQQDKIDEESVPPVREEILGFKEKYRERMSQSLVRESENEVRRRVSAAYKIQRWWFQRVVLRMKRYTQGGAWTLDASDRAFGMVLGHRVRRLLRSPRMLQNIDAQHDVQRILSDMCSASTSAKARTREHSAAAQLEEFRRTVDHHTVDDLLLKYPGISHTDLTLAKSMCKQLLTERQKLSQLVLGGARWRQFPAPGYWDLSPAVRREQTAAQEKENRLHNTTSPSRKLTARKTNMETPPSVRNAVRNSGSKLKQVPGGLHVLHGQNARVIPADEEYFEPGTGMTRVAGRRGGQSSEDEGVKRLRHSGERPERAIPAELLRTPGTAEEHNAGSKLMQVASGLHVLHGQNARVIAEGEEHLESATALQHLHTPEPPGERERDPVPVSLFPGGQQAIAGGHRHLDAPVAAVTSASSGSGSPQARRLRMSSRGHIQLNVLSAEKLMPARKGAPHRDANGAIVADRIPCLKVKMMLPNWTSGAGSRNQTSPESGSQSNMKKVFDQARDFSTVTLNPQWDALFTLNLPCPRSVVHSIATTEAARFYDPNEELTDRAYEVICRALLQWWSLGTVTIEVFDGERFNQDIGMGFIDLLLSGFMVLIKKVDDLEIKGSFQLNKVKPSDRVSGTVKLHAFLHVPEKAYIADLLDPSSRVTASVVHPERALAAHIEGNAASDLDETEDEQRAESWPSSNAHSPPEAPVRPPVVYSSKFMQSLARHSQQRMATPTSEIDPPAPPPVHQAASQVKSPGGRPTTAAAPPRAPLSDPHLEESVNIRYNAPAPGEMPSHQDIAESARLLKEKLRKSKTARKPAGRASRETTDAPIEELGRRRGEAQDSSFQVEEALRPSPEKHHSRSAPGSRIPVLAGAGSRPQKDQSVDSSGFRRRSMEDINERLAGLSAVQHSSDAVLSNLNFKLGEKLRSRNDVSVNESQVQDTSAEMNVSRMGAPRAPPSKQAMEEVRRRMARAELAEPEEDVTEENGDGEVVFHGLRDIPAMLPSDASLRRALHSSYSSREEDEDAPEMGAVSEEEASQNASYDTEDFQDTYDDAGVSPDERAPSPPPMEDLRGLSPSRHEPEEYWEYQSESENDAAEKEAGVPVWNAKRTDIDLTARRASPSKEGSPRRGAAHADDNESDDEFAEGNQSTRADLSTMSSEYSTSIMDFLSPEQQRGGRGGGGQPSSASARRHAVEEEEDEDSADELIVVGGSKESTMNSGSGSSYGKSSSRSPVKRFEVQSARLASPNDPHSSRGAADVHVRKPMSSPSRSLFSESAEGLPAPRSGGYGGTGSPPFSPEAERKRSVKSSPAGSGRGAVPRVVLELDDLEL